MSAFRIFLIIPLGTLLSLPAFSQVPGDCEPVIGHVASAEGMVELQRTDDPSWLSAPTNTVLCQGDIVRAGKLSRAALALANESILRIDQSTTVRLDNIVPQEEESSFMSLIYGAFQSFSRKPRQLKVDTPFLNGLIEGTEFVFRVTDDHTELNVLEGRVVASNEQGSLAVNQGEAVRAAANQAPQSMIVVQPRDSVQWGLYYPPLLAVLQGGNASGSEQIPDALRQAVSSAAKGDNVSAFAALDQVPVSNQDAQYHLYRAALYLSSGQASNAKMGIERALSLDSKNGLAYALRSIINVVQNERGLALTDAEQAVALSPNSAAANIALSYAQQANFDISASHNTMLQAAEQQPNDALVWARLSELWLMLGNRSEALEAAQQAETLAPQLARTQITRGFADLAEFHFASAESAFEQAITQNSADPLAHLGLGLARISNGNLAAGRQEIEVAVGLDSNNALFRAYLGKAYFEEKRYPLDAEQYSIAKSLDPLDPTAFLYSGILNQTLNRPVEALRDLETSIDLNDNRAVYRGRLLLDEDRAARGTSLARAYKSLGFTQLGTNLATESLSIDPSNASAHRFLADSYSSVRRREISRVSELLQAQLLQDINIDPVQPSVSETNLNAVAIGGPATPGFNEFTPLFQQNQTQFHLSGFGGDNSTRGGEAVITGLHDRFSFSLGAYTSETDGWRENNQLEQDIFNIYAQWAITPQLNVQAEFRRRESEEGDLAFNFDPDNFVSDKIIERNQDIARVGLRYSPNTKSDFILSYISSDRNDTLDSVETPDPFTTFFTDSESQDDGFQIEGQHIYRHGRFNLVSGLAYADFDTQFTDDFSVVDIEFGPVFEVSDTSKSQIEYPHGYSYAYLKQSESLTWTIGASYDDYQSGPIDKQIFNPKFGVQWNVSDKFSLRAAAFRVLKPALVNNRTIEPTQIAGFNQFFDDINATESRRYGVGFESRLTSNLTWGGEATWRDIKEPVLDFDEDLNLSVVYEDREEQAHRLYLYWTPKEQWAVTAEINYDLWKSEIGIVTEFDNLPEEVKTITLPIGVTYFNPSGLFASIGGTYVKQDVTRSEFANQGQGDDSFFLVDAAVGYRFAKRRGVISLGVKNLFDQDFNYQDDSYREFRDEPSTGPYYPERIILGRFTLGF